MKKMMFNERYGMESGVITGSKTMTRRDAEKVRLTYEVYRGIGEILSFNGVKERLEQFALRKSPFKVGDVVAVAQSYHTLNNSGFVAPEWLDHTCESSAGYENKMFVRADLMPHRIKITGVRFEKLQCISDEECLREGIYRRDDVIDSQMRPWVAYQYKGTSSLFRSPRDAFASLIDKVSGIGTWKSNPYVYVYSFTLIA